MEMFAVVLALEWIREIKPGLVLICSDSASVHWVQFIQESAGLKSAVIRFRSCKSACGH